MTIIVKLEFLLYCTLFCFTFAASDSSCPWMDSSLSVHVRVDLLVAAMTQQEKVSQLLSTHLYAEDTESFSDKYASTGFGVLLPCPRVRSPDPPPSATQCMQWRNDLQAHFMTQSRLHIPLSFREELLHSAKVPGATVFPMPTNLGASWNQSLVTAVYAVVAREARAAGVDYGFAPVLQVATNALW
jgi:beta-glucosidase-like glycosyl hydrolase